MVGVTGCQTAFTPHVSQKHNQNDGLAVKVVQSPTPKPLWHLGEQLCLNGCCYIQWSWGLPPETPQGKGTGRRHPAAIGLLGSVLAVYAEPRRPVAQKDGIGFSGRDCLHLCSPLGPGSSSVPPSLAQVPLPQPGKPASSNTSCWLLLKSGFLVQRPSTLIPAPECVTTLLHHLSPVVQVYC